MKKSVNAWKKLTLVASQVFLAGIGGACLPDNILAETAGEIVNGLIVTGVNTALAGGV